MHPMLLQHGCLRAKVLGFATGREAINHLITFMERHGLIVLIGWASRSSPSASAWQDTSRGPIPLSRRCWG
jgi:hypothetical protein